MPSEQARLADSGSGEPKDTSRGLRIAFHCLMPVGSLLLVVGLCEVLLWIVAPIPYHEWLTWEVESHLRGRPAPNQVVRNAAGYEVRINKDGFRAPDYQYPKPPGTLRIAVFSGSAGFCFCAAGREKTWPGALELKLQERLDLPVQVVNLSLPGYQSFKSKINYLCFGRAFHPDAIIVYHTWNDMASFRTVDTQPYISRGTYGKKPLWQRIARMTQIGRRARNFLWARSGRETEARYRRQEGTGRGGDRPVSLEGYAWERKNFEDFVMLAQSDGVLPILVSQASMISSGSLQDPETRLAMAHASEIQGHDMTLSLILEVWSKVSEIIEDVARKHGAIFVDGYHAVPHDTEHLLDYVHLRDAGSELLAEEIASVLLQDPRFQELVARVAQEALPASE